MTKVLLEYFVSSIGGVAVATTLIYVIYEIRQAIAWTKENSNHIIALQVSDAKKDIVLSNLIKTATETQANLNTFIQRVDKYIHDETGSLAIERMNIITKLNKEIETLKKQKTQKKIKIHTTQLNHDNKNTKSNA